MLSIPRMFKKVSCWPANEASGKSSAVADERTATAISGLPFERVAKASRTSFSNSSVSGVSTIHLRIFAPVSASAITSSTFNAASSALILALSPLCSRNSRYAAAVVAKPQVLIHLHLLGG